MLSETEYQQLIAGNPHLKVREEQPAKEKRNKRPADAADEFDSDAERRFYLAQVLPAMLEGIILRCDLHRQFEIVPAFAATCTGSSRLSPPWSTAGGRTRTGCTPRISS